METGLLVSSSRAFAPVVQEKFKIAIPSQDNFFGANSGIDSLKIAKCLSKRDLKVGRLCIGSTMKGRRVNGNETIGRNGSI